MTIRLAAARAAQTFRCQKQWRSLMLTSAPPLRMAAAASHRGGKYGVTSAASVRLPAVSTTNRNQPAIAPDAWSNGQPASATWLPTRAPAPPTTIMAA